MQRWLYDLAALRWMKRLRYYPAHAVALEQCALQLDKSRWAMYSHKVTRLRAAENHALNARLLIESLFLGYRTIFRAPIQPSSSKP